MRRRRHQKAHPFTCTHPIHPVFRSKFWEYISAIDQGYQVDTAIDKDDMRELLLSMQGMNIK
jgi:hypothetical protein